MPWYAVTCDHRRVPGGRSEAEREQPVQPEAIGAAAEASFANCDSERLRLLMQGLVRHLHAFVRAVDLTDSEWRAAIDVLVEPAGDAMRLSGVGRLSTCSTVNGEAVCARTATTAENPSANAIARRPVTGEL